MIIRFFLDIKNDQRTCLEQRFTPEELGLSSDGWNKLSFKQKHELLEQWADAHISTRFEEIK